jgi:hypothetical protein
MTRIVDRVYQKQLGRAANEGDYAWVQSFFKKTGTVSEVQLTNTIKDSQEYKRKANPEAYDRDAKTADRNAYKGNKKALEMYDLSVKIKGKAPTVGELNNWVRHGSVKEWEASLRGEIKWKNVVTETGTQGIKYYSKEALDRLGGKLPKGTDEDGELIAIPKSYKGPLSTDRLTKGKEVGDWIVMGQMGSERHGLVGKVFGSSAEKFMAKNGGLTGSLVFGALGMGPIGPGGLGTDSVGSTILYGEEGVKSRRNLAIKITGSEKRADRFLKYESRIEDIVAPIVDMIAFRGLPVVSTARKVSKGIASETLGQDVDWENIGKSIAVSWATRGIKNYIGGDFISNTLIDTAGNMVLGQKLDEAVLSAAAGNVVEGFMPGGTSPWITGAASTLASAAANKGTRDAVLGKSGKEVQVWSILGATASYVAGAGVESYLSKPKGPSVGVKAADMPSGKRPVGTKPASHAGEPFGRLRDRINEFRTSGQRELDVQVEGTKAPRNQGTDRAPKTRRSDRRAATNQDIADYIALGGVGTEERLSPYAA